MSTTWYSSREISASSDGVLLSNPVPILHTRHSVVPLSFELDVVHSSSIHLLDFPCTMLFWMLAVAVRPFVEAVRPWQHPISIPFHPIRYGFFPKPCHQAIHAFRHTSRKREEEEGPQIRISSIDSQPQIEKDGGGGAKKHRNKKGATNEKLRMDDD